MKYRSELQDLLITINHKFENQISGIFLPLGVTPMQAKVIAVIHKNEAVSVQKLTEDLQITYPNCSNILKRMVKYDLIEKVKDGDDKRIVKLKLTEKSLSLVDRIENKLKDIDLCFMKLDKEEYEMVTRSLNILNEILGD